MHISISQDATSTIIKYNPAGGILAQTTFVIATYTELDSFMQGLIEGSLTGMEGGQKTSSVVIPDNWEGYEIIVGRGPGFDENDIRPEAASFIQDISGIGPGFDGTIDPSILQIDADFDVSLDLTALVAIVDAL